MYTYVRHFLGIRNPSSPGLICKFERTSWQVLHIIEILVAFAFIPEALTIIPGTFTSLETISDFKSLKFDGFESDVSIICMSSTSSSSSGLGAVSSSATSLAASSKIGRCSEGCL